MEDTKVFMIVPATISAHGQMMSVDYERAAYDLPPDQSLVKTSVVHGNDTWELEIKVTKKV